MVGVLGVGSSCSWLYFSTGILWSCENLFVTSLKGCFVLVRQRWHLCQSPPFSAPSLPPSLSFSLFELRSNYATQVGLELDVYVAKAGPLSQDPPASTIWVLRLRVWVTLPCTMSGFCVCGQGLEENQENQIRASLLSLPALDTVSHGAQGL